ncbi:aldolase [Amaricoccus solimangrovi]|uniref:Aldolase n=1 Tax=Amaricoccus solimangrovi TaxID=2589815 RepID=A0A501WLY7_9RHOB|nr:aldolase [Amaricoccus solimangrovi]TPE48031.1 aldolase [Amaricoccus solimangrovi]
MAHELDVQRATRAGLDTPEIREARRDLAACLRMAARLGLQEGICNHFSAVVPAHPDLFVVNPYGLAFEEVRAADLVICDFEGNVLEGEGAPEATAFHIHAQLHRLLPRAAAAFHTHMPWATALAMTEGEPLVYAGQTALKFRGRVVYDRDYNGLALDAEEGARIAATLGDADVVFMRNHGVMVIAPTIAEAWDDLYYLERAAEAQIKALSTGRPLVPVPPQLAEKTARQIRAGDAESARLHLASVRRIIGRETPDYADLG